MRRGIQRRCAWPASWVAWQCCSSSSGTRSKRLFLPRRVRRRFRLTRSFYRLTWVPCRALGRRLRPGNFRENLLSVFGPLSLLFLLATWAFILVVAFALIQWGAGSKLNVPAGLHGFAADLYYSGTTLFTLGLGDVAPRSTAARHPDRPRGRHGAGIPRADPRLPAGDGTGILSTRGEHQPARRARRLAAERCRVAQAPCGSRRVRRAGAAARRVGALVAPICSRRKISFPVLAYYRSQHDNQSWLAALTTILDTCALIIVRRRKRAHACGAADLRDRAPCRRRSLHLFWRPPYRRCATGCLRRNVANCASVAGVGLPLRDGPDVEQKLHRLRRMYEPYVSRSPSSC